ncbi:MAG: DJ-1/PfpI family protein [Caldilineaceae bacterium]
MPGTAKGRKIAILTDDGANAADITQMQAALKSAGATSEVIAPHLGTLQNTSGGQVQINQRLMDVASVLYDAVYIPGGANAINAMKTNGDYIHFVQEAFKHYKPIAGSGEASTLLNAALSQQGAAAAGVFSGQSGSAVTDNFIKAIGQHRVWDRPEAEAIPA